MIIDPKTMTIQNSNGKNSKNIWKLSLKRTTNDNIINIEIINIIIK